MLKRLTALLLCAVLMMACVTADAAKKSKKAKKNQIQEAVTGEVSEAEDGETPQPDPTPTPQPTPTPAPSGDVQFVCPASVGSIYYAGTTGNSINVPAADLIAAIVTRYYGLPDGYYANIRAHLQSNIGGILNGGELPGALTEYKKVIEAAVSDIDLGLMLNAQKKQLNSKRAKKTTVVGKGLPQIAAYTGGEEEGYFYAFTGLKMASGAAKGTYYLQASLENGSAPSIKKLFDKATDLTLLMPFKIRKQSGGGGGGGGGSSKALPVARLIVDSVRTEPEKPSAGDVFDVILTLRNTSETLYLANLQLTYSAENDALTPAAGTNTVYIDRIDADSTYPLRLTVKSKPDLEESAVKLDISAEFEDKKMNALTATQSLNLSIQQVQRIQLDEPTLPTTDPTVGDTYEVKMGVFNLGKTMLYNVTVVAVPQNPDALSPGQSYFIGNMEPGTSKTADMELVPLESGQHDVKLQVNYETVNGAKSTESRDISFNAMAEEDYTYDDFSDTPIDDISMEPEKPDAMSVMRALPWNIYAIVAGLLALLLIWGGVSARRKRMRAMEDDEMD